MLILSKQNWSGPPTVSTQVLEMKTEALKVAVLMEKDYSVHVRINLMCLRVPQGAGCGCLVNSFSHPSSRVTLQWYPYSLDFFSDK